MMRYVTIALAFLGLSMTAWADTIKLETDAKQVTEKFMSQVAKGDLATAFSLIKPYVVIPEAEFQTLVLQTKSQRDQFGARYGKSNGYELVSERKAGQSILRLIYVETTERHALPWVFFFYKTPAGWVLNSFAWNDQIQNAFQQ